MAAPADLYLFFLGVAAGLAVLSLTAYRGLAPAWLRWLLIAAGGFVITRYVTMACFAVADDPAALWGWRRCWFASAVGLTLPGVFAMDQLIRHPAMTPRKVLIWYAPFGLAYAAALGFGGYAVVPDRLLGWAVRLTGAWPAVLAIVQGIFCLGYVGLALFLFRKLPVPGIRMALLGLALAFTWLAADGLLLAAGRWYVRPFLFSEMAALLAIWYAFDAGRSAP